MCPNNRSAPSFPNAFQGPDIDQADGMNAFLIESCTRVLRDPLPKPSRYCLAASTAMSSLAGNLSIVASSVAEPSGFAGLFNPIMVVADLDEVQFACGHVYRIFAEGLRAEDPDAYGQENYSAGPSHALEESAPIDAVVNEES
jgi:hypothetical protein